MLLRRRLHRSWRAPLLAVICAAALTGLFATASWRPAAGAPSGGTSSAPAAAMLDSYSATVTNGASENDLYLFLAARQGHMVTLSLQVKAPVKASISGNPKTLVMSSGCGGTKPAGNCAAALALSGVTYVLQDVGTATRSTLSYASSVYTVTGRFVVGDPTLSAAGMATVPLRAVSLGGPAGAEDDE
jgi:hypothetical protein